MTRELKRQQDALVPPTRSSRARAQFHGGGAVGRLGRRHRARQRRSHHACSAASAERLLGFVEVPKSSASRWRMSCRNSPRVLSTREDETGSRARAQRRSRHSLGGEERTFAVRVTRESAGDGDVGSVVTFDDVTELVPAQRTAAWADVARRIAHEIKNPLTPIQLSAERLRRKYGKQITDDRETVRPLTHDHRAAGRPTQDAWSTSSPPSRACPSRRWRTRTCAMPCRSRRCCSAKATRTSTSSFQFPTGRFDVRFDRRLIIAGRDEPRQERERRRSKTYARSARATARLEGRASRRSSRRSDRVAIEVIDNGVGLPKQNRAKLLEPYVTTKGTRALASDLRSCRRS